MINETQLTEAMVEIAKDLTSIETINETTIVGDVLPNNGENDGTNLANTFYLGIKWTIAKNGGTNKDWPSKWGEFIFGELARNLLALLLLLFSLTASSQLTINLNGSQTDLKRAAIGFSIDYLRSVDSIIGEREVLVIKDKSIFQIMPAFHIQTGSEDAASSIEAKITGLLLAFKTRQLSNGVTIPDFGRAFASFPFSAGIETNDRFSFVNSVAEAGFVPVFTGRSNSDILKHTRIGVYLQGGYKFKTTDSLATSAQGGDKDASLEDVNSPILRAHGSILLDTKGVVPIGTAKLGVVASAEGWQDFLNGAFYSRIDAILRLYVSQTYMLDFIYQYGSGAPLFNEARQVGVGLTAKF